jgi:hypothetical protein
MVRPPLTLMTCPMMNEAVAPRRAAQRDRLADA